MSAEQKVQMEFVISSASLDRLQAIMSGGASGGKEKGVGKLQSIMQQFTIGNVAKLAVIAGIATTGVGLVKQLTKMVISSSPMLQSVLKLLNVGIMFVLRPIGDFVGFLLRPLMIYLLRSVFLPWYRQMAPLMRTWGAGLGESLLNFVKDPFGTLQEWVEGTMWGKIAALFLPIVGISYLASKIHDLIKDLDIDLGEITGAVGEKVTQFFNGIGTTLQSWSNTLTNTMSVLGNFLSTGIGAISEKIGSAWTNFTTFFNGSLGLIGTLLGGAWSGFTTWIFETLGGVGSTLQAAWDTFTSFFNSIGSVWSILGNAWNNFVSFIGDLGNILNTLNPGNWFANIGESLSKGTSQLFGGNTNNNSVDVSIQGGSPQLDIEGLKHMLFGWMEDNNSMRY